MVAPPLNPAPLDLDQFQGFTPGPWIAYRRAAAVFIVNSGGMTPIDDPDAALIAAAPALLAECQRQREEIERLLSERSELRAALEAMLTAYARPLNGDSQGWMMNMGEAADAARAALSDRGEA